jgi:small GTP-binding protein
MKQVSKKIILVGYFGVGKTSLVKQFVHSIFSDKYLTTIGVNIEKKEIVVGDTALTFLIWDLAGEESLNRMNGAYFKGSSGALYVFDVSRPETYVDLSEKLNAIPAKVGKEIPVFAIGNKSDLLEASELDLLKDQLGAMVYTFTSAKTGDQVEASFVALGEAILNA